MNFRIAVIILFFTSIWIYSQDNSTIKIKIDPTVRYQTMDGFGASDAWRAQFVGKNWPMDKRETGISHRLS